MELEKNVPKMHAQNKILKKNTANVMKEKNSGLVCQN